MDRKKHWYYVPIICYSSNRTCTRMPSNKGINRQYLRRHEIVPLGCLNSPTAGYKKTDQLQISRALEQQVSYKDVPKATSQKKLYRFFFLHKLEDILNSTSSPPMPPDFFYRYFYSFLEKHTSPLMHGVVTLFVSLHLQCKLQCPLDHVFIKANRGIYQVNNQV